MTIDRNRQRLPQILGALANELDVPPSKYEEAKEHYDAVGRWLRDDDSELAPFDPQISMTLTITGFQLIGTNRTHHQIWRFFSHLKPPYFVLKWP